ncbi:sulfotransferase domain protein [Halalkalicoccus paucihalophilus]|uniref:Sulfotransferase domain protein n=1 Tax=Halalkalicoccus paucihalophilus TaxID=1008153 RepID=A0A151AA23_9EURY|nr:sulfotransferase domain-containing protein [Halalkalicoccus paucihalophilus]KYH24400.1 sulfotransferase domain protein [Halalkalicoccus paucihalophilus]
MSLEESSSDLRDQAKQNYEHVKNTVITEEKRSFLSKHRIDEFDSVVLITSSPRGGSSLLFDILRHHEETCSPDGEHGRWYTLNGICYPAFESDVVPANFESFDREKLLTDLLAEVGATERSGDRTHRVDNTLVRLPLQFPDRELPYEQVRKELLEGTSLNEILERFGISPLQYDEYAERDADSSFENETIEDRPFVSSHGHKRSLTADDFERTLVLKASGDAYRLPWIREQLFPETEVKVVHLTRNPAASINGLYDGWRLNRGFQTYNVGDLNLEGYDGSLWCYDLPPDWSSEGKLIDVCLQQWVQAHRHILNSRDAFEDVLRIRFEDILTETDSVIKEIVEFADLGKSELLSENVENPNKVMTTKEPARARWRSREGLVKDALNRADETYSEVVEELEYTEESEWI